MEPEAQVEPAAPAKRAEKQDETRKRKRGADAPILTDTGREGLATGTEAHAELAARAPAQTGCAEMTLTGAGARAELTQTEPTAETPARAELTHAEPTAKTPAQTGCAEMALTALELPAKKKRRHKKRGGANKAGRHGRKRGKEPSG